MGPMSIVVNHLSIIVCVNDAAMRHSRFDRYSLRLGTPGICNLWLCNVGDLMARAAAWPSDRADRFPPCSRISIMELLSIATASAAAGLLTTSAFRLATATWHRAHSSLQNRRWRREEQLWLKRDTQHARMASELKRQSAETSSSNWRVTSRPSTRCGSMHSCGWGV